MPDENDWIEWKRLILDSMEDMKGFRKDVNKRFDRLTKDVAVIKTQMKNFSAKWALLAGVCVAVGGNALIQFFLG